VITIVLDDDPTGTQAMSDVAVILDWLASDAWGAVHPGDHAVHLLTNSRAHDSAAAAELVASAAISARTRFPESRVILRGDSTLRAHLWEEYEALASVIAPHREGVPLLLVPALPAAGRVTIGGVHLIERDGDRVALDQTEYARDGAFAYSSAELGRWAQERSGGRFSADDAIMITLDRLRASGGAAEVALAIAAAAQRGRPAVVVPDAENEADLVTIAAGLRLAESRATAVVVRCAPAFVAALTGVGAAAVATPPSGEHGVLVLCGSFVATSTAQIEQLEHAYPGVMVPTYVAALAGDEWGAEVERVSTRARSLIDAQGLAAIVTERRRDPTLVDVGSQRRIAVALAQVAKRVGAGVVIAKGGITAAVTAREGLGVRAARVIGPIRPGVARWRLADGSDFVVVPGNVGETDLLVELVGAIGPRRVAAGVP
jgi:Sugar-binding N-terminal domain/Nucleotide-binding C-terminal domain